LSDISLNIVTVIAQSVHILYLKDQFGHSNSKQF